MSNQKQNLRYYIRLLYPFLKKDIGLLVFGLFAMLCTSALQLVFPLILANIVDKSIPSGNVSQMYRYGAMFIAAVLVSGGLTYLQTVLLSKLGVKVITKFKAQVFRHLLTLPVDWFNQQAVGELIARVESDAERVKALFSDLSIRIIGNLLVFVGVFVIMFLILYSSIFDLNLLSYDFNLKDDIPPIPIAYYMKNQWHDGNFWFSYVKNDRTSFYEEARSDSSLLKVFHKYEVVTAILRKRVKDEVWILVGTYDPSGNYLIYGWIKEDQIIIKSDFKPVDKFEYKSIIIGSKKDGNIFEFYFNLS